jgi:hypothetical protein
LLPQALLALHQQFGASVFVRRRQVGPQDIVDGTCVCRGTRQGGDKRGRTFIKPLVYDTRTDEHPDYMLLDTDPPTVIEVWGMHGLASSGSSKNKPTTG